MRLSKEFFQQNSDVVNDKFDVEPEYISACLKQETIWDCYAGAPANSEYLHVPKFDKKAIGNSLSVKESAIGWRLPDSMLINREMAGMVKVESSLDPAYIEERNGYPDYSTPGQDTLPFTSTRKERQINLTLYKERIGPDWVRERNFVALLAGLVSVMLIVTIWQLSFFCCLGQFGCICLSSSKVEQLNYVH